MNVQRAPSMPSNPKRTRGILAAYAATLSMGMLAACGSTSDQSSNSSTSSTATNNPVDTTPTTTTTAPDQNPPSSGTTTPTNTTPLLCTVPNCDAFGTEPTLSPLSSQVSVQNANATEPLAVLQYVSFQNGGVNADSNRVGTLKQYELAALDYDNCIFAFNHAQVASGVYNYDASPAAQFNFAGIYLVNNMLGSISGDPNTASDPNATDAANSTPLVAGTYSTVAGSTLQVLVNTGTSGMSYAVDSCQIGSYASITSGTVTIDAIQSDGVTPVSGSFNLQLSDSNTLAGQFMVGSCSSGFGTQQPIAPNPDVNACTL